MRYIFLVLFLALFSGCKTNETNSNFIVLNKEFELEPIKGETIMIDSLYFPTKLHISDSLLVVLDIKSKKNLHLFDMKNNEYILSFGERGKGPGEFIGLGSISQFQNEIWAYDLTLGKNVSFNIDSILKGGKYSFSNEIKHYDRARRSYTPLWMNDSTVISPTMSDSDYRLVVSDKSGNVIGEEFKMFPAPSSNTPSSIHHQSYHAVFKKCPSKSKFVLANRYSDLIEIYDLRDSTSIRLKTHGNYQPEYVIENANGRSRMAQTDKMRFGYIDVAVTDKIIYTLFSGRVRTQHKKGNYGNIVILYDWEGNYISSYTIEEDSISIEAVNDKEFLTLETVNGLPTVKKYQI